MYICPCAWALKICKKFGIRTYFGSVTVESVCGFLDFTFWRHGFELATFFIVHMNCIFWGTSFELIKNLATSNPETLQGFYGTALFHCYTPIPLLQPTCNDVSLDSEWCISILFKSLWERTRRCSMLWYETSSPRHIVPDIGYEMLSSSMLWYQTRPRHDRDTLLMHARRRPLSLLTLSWCMRGALLLHVSFARLLRSVSSARRTPSTCLFRSVSSARRP